MTDYLDTGDSAASRPNLESQQGLDSQQVRFDVRGWSFADDKNQILYRPDAAAIQRAAMTVLVCFGLAIGGTWSMMDWLMPGDAKPANDAEQAIQRQMFERQTEKLKELFLKDATPEQRTEFERSIQEDQAERETNQAEAQERISAWRRNKTIIQYALLVPASLLIGVAIWMGTRHGVVVLLRHGKDRIRLMVDAQEQLVVSRPGFGSWIKPVHECRSLATLQPISWRVSQVSGTGNPEGLQSSWTWIVTLKSGATKVSDRLEFTIVTQYRAPDPNSGPPDNVVALVAALRRLTKQVQN